ncbi:MAG: hypothetical protein K0S71_1592 [Clostridia bacterium]|jgi:hypothetical protein|nr:hypothetical protein [Clostridia bacterium]
MPLQDTLKKAKYDIENGNLGIARDRVNSLIYSYPNELSLRKMLGDIYWELRYPAMAGRFWYLEEHKTQNMISACKIFEKECGNHPYLILKSIKFRGNLKNINNNYAREVLITLEKEKSNRIQRETYKYKTTHNIRKENLRHKLRVILWSAMFLILLCLMMVGLGVVIYWIQKW